MPAETVTVLLKLLNTFGAAAKNEISTRYAGFGTWDVADATHTDEYNKTYREGTSTQISLEELINAVGRKSDKAAILKDAEEKEFFDTLFAGDK